MTDMENMRVKPWEVQVAGYGYSQTPYFEASRGKAIASAWGSPAFEGMSFKDFLKIVRCARAEPSERYGERFTISGRAARYISHNRQYVQFVWEGGDVVLNTHPLDIDQPEARRGTPYYERASIAA
ncbi:MAG: hypothetical protein EON55_28300 [Alphaproteobacteria bacterium]|nr:MAG: hypothetical protein EON55_28300 [Alphaproteobacteria bacterium]